MAAAANIKIMKTYVALPSLFLSLKTCKDHFYFKNTKILLQQQNMYLLSKYTTFYAYNTSGWNDHDFFKKKEDTFHNRL